jgi:hypothetical protein
VTVTDGERFEAWERRRREQVRAWLHRSYGERLAWLEQAKRFAATAMQAARKRRRDRDRSA